jgi:DNA-binding response OmpR family regulator
VVVIAPTKSERVRLAALLEDEAPVLLAARVSDAVAVLGEAEPPVRAPAVVRAASPTPPVWVDSDARVARCQGRSVSLAPLEHDLLVCLLGSVGHTLTFEEIHRHVWGNDHLGDRSDLTSAVKRLRRKLAELGSPVVIHSVRGVGLRLVDATESVCVVPTS